MKEDSEKPTELNDIFQLIQKYSSILKQKFDEREQALVEELETKGKQLQTKLGQYKYQTSKQNMEKLINKRRAEKQQQRLGLEINWRQLTSKYKKYQEEEKMLIDENKEAEFELNNLRAKIKEIEKANHELEGNIGKLEEKQESFPFLTESKQENYQSPYRYAAAKSTVSTKKQVSLPKAMKNWQTSSQIFQLQKRSNMPQEAMKVQTNTKQNEPFSRLKQDKDRLENHDKLMKYLELPQVRDAIFEILRRDNYKK